MNIQSIDINLLNPAKYNPRKDLQPSDAEYVKLKQSIEHFGYVEPIIVNKRNNVVVGGHQRLKVLIDLGYKDADVVYVDLNDTDEKALNVALNKISGDWDAEKLEDLLRELSLDDSFDVELTGFTEGEIDELFGSAEDIDVENNKKAAYEEAYNSVEHYTLKEIYGMPPLSVLNMSILNTRDNDWDKNNKFWKDKIQDHAEARKNAYCMNRGFDNKDYIKFKSNVVSIMDPTLCELINKWFCPNKDHNKVFDTFAGDTSFGFVSTSMNNEFTGIELREEQSEFNNNQLKNNNLDRLGRYICDDGRNVDKYIEDNSMDLFFSCPPYYDLEKYSDKENDASNQETYEDFYKILDTAFKKAIKCLKNNRFAVVVAGDVRNKKTGAYYDFLGDIKKTFMNNGCLFYNEMILVNKVGSKSIMSEVHMKKRKMLKIHQNVLVFFKGDQDAISKEFYNIKEMSIEEIKEKYDVQDNNEENEDDINESTNA